MKKKLGKTVTKIKKKISFGVIHVKVTFNNTIIAFSDVQGNVIVVSGAGAHGFKGAKKSTPYAAQVVIESVMMRAKQYGLKTLSIKIQGPGSQRESALRSIFNQGLLVTSIADVTPMPHNGSRPPKRRRV